MFCEIYRKNREANEHKDIVEAMKKSLGICMKLLEWNGVSAALLQGI